LVDKQPATQDTPRRDNPRAGFLWGLASPLTAALIFFLVPMIASEMGLFGMGPIWFTLGALCYLLVLLFGGNISRLVPPKGFRFRVFLIGVLQAVSTALFFGALLVAEPAPISFLANGTTIFTVVLSAIFLKERLNLGQLIGGALVIAGALVMTWAGDSGNTLGAVLILSSGLTFSLHSLIVRQITTEVHPASIGFWRCLAIAVSFLIVALFNGDPLIPASTQTGLLLVIGAVIGPFLSIFTYYQALKNWGAGKVDLLRASLPLWVLILVFIEGGEVPTGIRLLGGGVTIIGVVVLLLFRRYRKQKLIEVRDAA